MKVISGIIKNSGSMLLGSIIRMVSSFVLVIFVAKYLGSAGMGKFTLVLTLFWIFQTVATMGLEPLIIREVAKNRSKTQLYLTNASFLGLIAAVGAAGLMVLFAIIASYPGDVVLATYWMGAALAISTVGVVLQAVFIAYEKAEFVLLGMTFENILKMILGIAVLRAGFGIVALAGIMTAAQFLGLILYFILMHRSIVRLLWKLDFQLMKWLLSMAPTFVGISVFNTLFWHIDILLLSKLCTMEQLGIYSAAMRLVSVLKLVLQSYKVSIQPIAAKTFGESMAAFQDFCAKSLKYIFIATLPICVGGSILSDQIILLLFGQEFLLSSTIFRYAIWTLLPYGMILVFASFLIASNNQKVDLKVNAISMLFSVVVGVPLILTFGIYGAVASLLISLTVFLIQQLHFMQTRLCKLNYPVILKKISIATAVMGVVVALLRFLPLIVNVAVGIAVYGSILIYLKELTIYDIRFIKQMRK